MGAPGWIITYTKHHFDFANVEQNEVYILDIAHSLSMTCRFGGHLPKFYSVAEHSCHMFDIYSEKDKAPIPILKLLLLLHDGSEAYLNDIVRPIKHSLPDYLKVEKLVQDHINFKLVENPLNYHPTDFQMVIIEDIVKYYDDLMLFAEKEIFFQEDTWEYKPDNYDAHVITQASKRIKGWKPAKGKKEFLSRYNKIISMHNLA